MTNNLVGAVYETIIDGVVDKSRNAFEEFGVSVGTLQELETDWKRRLTLRNVAPMPWDPKPEPVQSHAATSAPPSTIPNGLTPSSYTEYESSPANGAQIKQEYGGLPNGYSQGGVQPEGGAARAAQLMQQQYGTAASASVSAMQRGTGLALPGQQQQSKPQGLQLPAQSVPSQQQFHRQQQQQFQQQQTQSRIKVESLESPQLAQAAQPNYSQTDGADDALDQWKQMLAQRRALHAAHGEEADHLMRNSVLQHSAELQSGLMMPLDELPSNKRLKHTAASNTRPTNSPGSAIPQLDGLADDEDDEKPDIKDEDEINSDLDDSSDDGRGPLGDDDDENVDSILCTYDKVQRVKNKWKCTLKDGIMSANGKEWIFAKGMGEFEW